jgi:hypothetical protein
MSKPFKIDISDEALTRLKKRLELTTFPTQLEGSDLWAYGAPVKDVKRLVEYWQNGFNWRKVEAELNQIPQYILPIEIEGFGPIDVHYVYQKSEMKDAIPLLFVHGWPGSFIEAKKLLPLLKGGDAKPAFHVVAPSLPNFGFSSGVTKAGFHLEKYAEVCHKLMLELGFDKYGIYWFESCRKNSNDKSTVTQSGDWGFFTTRAMGLIYPDNVLASHINMVRSNRPTFSKHPMLALQHAIFPYTKEEKESLERSAWFAKEGSAYRSLQATKPQTLGFALQDSPVALLAWIYEV